MLIISRIPVLDIWRGQWEHSKDIIGACYITLYWKALTFFSYFPSFVTDIFHKTKPFSYNEMINAYKLALMMSSIPVKLIRTEKKNTTHFFYCQIMVKIPLLYMGLYQFSKSRDASMLPLVPAKLASCKWTRLGLPAT